MALGIIFLATGSVFAASEEVQEIVLASEEKVTSVDNTFIVDVDLDSFTPSAQITDVTEDDENYYIIYTLYTIDLSDGKWGTVSQSKEVVVSRELLGEEDLGVYVAEEIKEVTDRQSSYLKEVQTKERKKGETQKVVSTTYSGLIGKYLDPKEEVIADYEPVVKPSEPIVLITSNVTTESTPEETNTETQTTSVADSQTQTQQNETVTVSSGTSASTGSGATMSMIGKNPAKVPTSAVGSGYSDNGVRAKDSKDQDLSVTITVNGTPMREVDINTRVPGMHVVRYMATDQSGSTMALERTVMIYDRYKMVAPAIVILGDTIVTSTVGEPYTDAGAIAIDYDDGDITGKVITESTVATTTGAYKVQYSVTDSDDNTTTAARIVNVVE
tara:strand:- start:3043 stop:4200 length:1158 start_codon:yes stop_codon:yes gene_type:complete